MSDICKSLFEQENFDLNDFSYISKSSSIETTKSELIQRILDSIRSQSASTTNTSLSSIDQIERSSSLKEIYLYFKDKNELGQEPKLDDLIAFIEDSKNCSCHRMDIRFQNTNLNQQLSYKEKQTILKIILRRQKIFNQYFS